MRHSVAYITKRTDETRGTVSMSVYQISLEASPVVSWIFADRSFTRRQSMSSCAILMSPRFLVKGREAGREAEMGRDTEMGDGGR